MLFIPDQLSTFNCYKIVNSGKSRLFVLNALDQNSVYQVGGEDRSYTGQGGKSIVNVMRYQHLLNPKARFGAVMMNRFYHGGGYGHLLDWMVFFY